MRYVVIVFIVFWFSNSFILQQFYNVEDYYGWVAFVKTRWIVYESMFLILIVTLFMKLAHLEKALLCFISILIAGSIGDKLLGVNSYMYGDIVLVSLSLIISFFVWRKYRKK